MVLMVLFDMLLWWYTAAWIEVLQKAQRRAVGVFEAFSVSLLARTLFSPFRQIDAGKVRGPIGIQLRAWFDRSFSRVFGAVVRSVMILCGLAGTVGVFCAGVVWAAAWLVMPVLPILGIIAVIIG